MQPCRADADMISATVPRWPTVHRLSMPPQPTRQPDLCYPRRFPTFPENQMLCKGLAPVENMVARSVDMATSIVVRVRNAEQQLFQRLEALHGELTLKIITFIQVPKFVIVCAQLAQETCFEEEDRIGSIPVFPAIS
eukprot:5264688-Prymnesium_polylepis.1